MALFPPPHHPDPSFNSNFPHSGPSPSGQPHRFTRPWIKWFMFINRKTLKGCTTNQHPQLNNPHFASPLPLLSKKKHPISISISNSFSRGREGPPREKRWSSLVMRKEAKLSRRSKKMPRAELLQSSLVLPNRIASNWEGQWVVFNSFSKMLPKPTQNKTMLTWKVRPSNVQGWNPFSTSRRFAMNTKIRFINFKRSSRKDQRNTTPTVRMSIYISRRTAKWSIWPKWSSS